MAQGYAADGRPLPQITPVTMPFFDAARRGEFWLQRCPRDGFFFYPRARCPICLSDDWNWRAARPFGSVHSFTVDQSGLDPHQRPFAPLLLAIVDLADGPRLAGTVVGCEPGRVGVGMPVSIEFKLVDDAPLIRFRPRPVGKTAI